MRFFDSTPVGRILNRATEDQNAVDTQLCFAFGSLIAQAFSLVGQVCCSVLQCVVVCCSVLQFFAVCFAYGSLLAQGFSMVGQVYRSLM